MNCAILLGFEHDLVFYKKKLSTIARVLLEGTILGSL